MQPNFDPTSIKFVNACTVCEVVYKCKYNKKINATLMTLAEDMLDENDVDVDFFYIVKDCPRCRESVF